MKVTDAKINQQRKEIVVRAGRRIYQFPIALLGIDEPLIRVARDPEAGNEAIECTFVSGTTRMLHLDDIRAHLLDSDYLREQMLYDLTLRAQQQMTSRKIAKRAVCRMLGTSPTQLYRLLDQTCYTKTLDQMVRLLAALGCRVKLTAVA